MRFKGSKKDLKNLGRQIELMLNPENEWSSLQSIRYAIVYGYKEETYVNRIKALANVDACYGGMYLPELIPAVLELLGVEKYNGDNKHTITLIEEKLSIPELIKD